MLRFLSNRRSRWWFFVAIIPVTLIALWFRPVASGRAILPLVAAGQSPFGPNGNRLQVFRNPDELPSGTVLHDSTPIDWSTHSVIRVQTEAPGYQIATGAPTDNVVQYGTIELSPRYGGRKWFAFLNEPMPAGIGNEVRQVASTLMRETWIAVPRGVEIQWIGHQRLQALDAGFLVGAILLAAAELRALSSQLPEISVASPTGIPTTV